MRLLRLTALLVLTALLASAATAGAAALITGAQVKNGSLTGKDIRDGSITRSDLSRSARGLDGAQGPKGDTGATGAAGPQGEAGAPRIVKYVSARSTSSEYGALVDATVRCPEDAPYAVAGGFELGGTAGQTVYATTLQDIPTTDQDGKHRGWRAVARNENDGGPLIVKVYATCMDVPVP